MQVALIFAYTNVPTPAKNSNISKNQLKLHNIDCTDYCVKKMNANCLAFCDVSSSLYKTKSHNTNFHAICI